MSHSVSPDQVAPFSDDPTIYFGVVSSSNYLLKKKKKKKKKLLPHPHPISSFPFSYYYCKAYSFYLLSFKDPVKKNRGYYLVIVVYNQTKLSPTSINT